MSVTAEGSALELVVFILDDQRYALRLPAVERVLPMVGVTPLPKAPSIALGMINLHGQVIPVVDIRRRFGLPPRDFALSARLLIARTARRALAVRVHEVLGVREASGEVVLGRKRSCPASRAWRASPPSRRALS